MSAGNAVQIRDATAEDIPPMMEIYHHAVMNTATTCDTEPRTIEQQRTWFHSHGPRHPILVATLDNAVVGWASLSVWIARGACCFTAEASVYVATQFRHSGVGRGLLSALIERARGLGYHVLIAQVIGGNEASLSFVQSLGFEQVGTLREVGRKFDRWLDLHILQLTLPCHPD